MKKLLIVFLFIASPFAFAEIDFDKKISDLTKAQEALQDRYVKLSNELKAIEQQASINLGAIKQLEELKKELKK